jgi:hypothetical protein
VFFGLEKEIFGLEKEILGFGIFLVWWGLETEI